MLIDDLQRTDGLSTLGTYSEVLSDRVMGGLSDARLERETHGGRSCLHLHRKNKSVLFHRNHLPWITGRPRQAARPWRPMHVDRLLH